MITGELVDHFREYGWVVVDELDPAEFLASAAEVIDHPVLLAVLAALRR